MWGSANDSGKFNMYNSLFPLYHACLLMFAFFLLLTICKLLKAVGIWLKTNQSINPQHMYHFCAAKWILEWNANGNLSCFGSYDLFIWDLTSILGDLVAAPTRSISLLCYSFGIIFPWRFILERLYFSKSIENF